MNAFDATRAGAGDTGLASLFAATATPANGPGALPGAQGATPFAQLLDQLNALPVAQESGTPVLPGQTVSEEPVALMSAPTSTLSALPGQQFRLPVGEFAPIPTHGEPAPARVPEAQGGLRLPVIGKLLPPVATSGTILPAQAMVEALPGEKLQAAAELPFADQPVGPAAGDVAQVVPLPVTQPISAAWRPPVIAAAVPMRSAGAVRADRPAASDTALPSSPGVPAIMAAPAAPAVTLTVAEGPVAAAGGQPAAAEHASVEAPVAAAPARPASPFAAELHISPASAEASVGVAQIRPEPQQPAMQDLTQIVERLAAAREAAAPATTQLAVEHAEFGPLSLSIQQGDRGELAIAVAAANRDSQAALVAAMTQAEAPGFEQAPDRRGSESAQRDATGAGQQGEQRGQGAQRDRFAGHQQREPMPQREPARGQDGETRSDTYA